MNNLLKNIILTSFCFASSLLTESGSVFSQPANSTCLTATAITIPGSGTICVSGTNLGSINDGTYNSCDVLPAGNQVWYTFVTQGTMNVVTVTPSGGAGSAQKVVVTLSEYGCGSGSYQTCNASATNGGTATASWGYAAGTQVWVQVTTNGADGNFQLCITSTNPPPSPGEACGTATLLCDKSTFSVSSTSSFTPSGTYPSCFTSAVQQDLWYKFTVGQSGTLQWDAAISGNAEYDWALYDITMGCPGSLVACNYNYASGTGATIGIGPSSCLSCPTSGFNNSACAEHCPTINVTAGNTYALMIDNYSANGVGFTMSWGGTFQMAPTANFTVSPASGCGSVTACFTNTSVSATSYNWDFANGNTSTSSSPPCQTYSSPGVYMISLIVTSASGCTDVASGTVTVSAGPTLTASTVNINCFGQCTGQASVTPSGGTPAYTYSWSGGGASSTKTGLCAGNATVTVTDATGCMNTVTVTITQPASALTGSATGTNASCNGVCDGLVTASGSGGTSPYTYSWCCALGTGATKSSLCAGAYTVTVTDNLGCTATASYTVTQPAVITAGFTYNGNQCLTGNSFSFTNTGTMGVTYSWSFPGGSPSSSTLENPAGISWGIAGTYTITQTVTSGSCMNTATLNIVIYPQPAVTVSKTDISCFGLCTGNATATGSGGTSPYTFNWSNGVMNNTTISNVCANSYTVTITDANGCTGTATVSVTQPAAALSATVTGVNVTCNGACNGMGSVTVGGGTSPYTYQWGATTGFQTGSAATALCAGTHSVTVTDNKGCTATGSVAVTQPAAMVLTVTSTNSTCGSSTGSISVSVSGGTPSFTYNWTGGCMNSACSSLGAGSYTVTVTDGGGCTQTATGTVNDAGGISASIAINQNVLCAGQCNGSATASVTGGTTPYTYSWSTGTTSTSNSASQTATGLCGGNISVTVTDASGCASSGAGVISAPSALTGISTVVNESCPGRCNGSVTISASGGVNPYTYSWPGGPIGPVTNKTNLCNGTYVVTVTDVNGCTIIVTGVVNSGTAVSVSVTGSNATCYNVCNAGANMTVSGGTPAYTYLWSNSATTEDITNICDGTYTVTVTDVNGCTAMGSVTLTEPAVLTVTVSTVPATCGQANGTATATAGGGTGAYTYLWNDPAPAQSTSTANGLLGGGINVTVTDGNGCTVTGSGTVGTAAGGTASITISGNVTCFGLCNGSATASMTGGTSPFTYIWSGGGTSSSKTGLCAGAISVTVTDFNGCTGSATATVTQPPVLTATITDSIDLLCYNSCTGIVTVTASGGTGGYNYLWNPVVSTGSTASALCASAYNITVTDGNGCTKTAGVTLTQPSQLTVSISGTPASCSSVCDGTASATAGGGTAPYSYLWSNSGTVSGATGLCGGATYSVTVTDAKSCTATSSYTVSTLANITLTVTSTDATCGQSNGTVTVSAANGIAPFTYVWNGGCASSNCTNLIANPYQVTVTDSKGCTAAGSATVSNVAGPTASISSVTDVTCNGRCDGAASALVTDGVPSYSYLWSNSATGSTATGLCSGTASVVVTDANGCITSVSATINQPAVLSVSINSTQNISCKGLCNGAIGLSVTGGTSPYSYSWSNSQTGNPATGLCAGNYLVTVTDSKGCTANVSGTVTEPQQLAVSLVADSANCNTACDGSAIAAPSGGTPPYAYSWNNSQTGSIAINLCAATYLVTVTDASACTVVAPVTVFAPITVVAGISSSGNVTCAGSANGYAQTAVSGGTPSYIYSWSNGQTTGQAVNLNGGDYTVTVTDAYGCSDTARITILAPPPIFVPVIGTNDSCYNACGGQAAAVVSGGTAPYSYLWDGNTGFQTTTAATGLCADNYDVTVTDGNGCTGTGSVILTQPQQLSFVDNPVSSTCGNPNGSACINVLGGVLPYSILWDDINNTAGACANGLIAGVYNPVVADGNGCTVSLPVIINDIAGPTIDSITTTDVSCSGASNGSASAYISSGTFPFTYIWKKGSITVSTGGAAVFNIQGGNYTFTVIDGNGCVTSLSFVINEPNTVVSAIINQNNAGCYGLCNGNATVGVAGGIIPYTYQWSAAGQTTSIATGLCAGLYNVLIIDSLGCNSTSQVTITEPAEITVTSDVDSVNCFSGSDGSISLPPSPTGGTPPYVYTWLPAGTGSGAIVTNLPAGTYYLTVTDIMGCTLNQSIDVEEPFQLVASTTSVEERCGNNNGSAAVLVGGGTMPYSYFWIPGGSASPIITNIQAGTYSVLVTDEHGCTDADTVVVAIILGPDIDLQATQNAACYGNADGIADVVIVRQSTPPYTYSWNPNISSSGTATGLAAGQYMVTMTDSIGCYDADTVQITEPAQIVVTCIPNTYTICYGQSTQILASASGGIPGYSYTWSDITLIGGGPHTVTPGASTVYNVTITDGSGCTATGFSDIAVLPPLDVTAPDVSICEGEAAVLTAYPAGGNGSYTYTWSNGFFGSTQTITGITSQQTYPVILGDNCSLSDTDTVIVYFNALPVVNFSANTYAGCQPLPVQFTDNSIVPNGNIGTWLWDFGDNSGSGQQSPVHLYIQSGSYDVTLIVTSTAGCSDSLTYAGLIVLYPVPQAFFIARPETTTTINPLVHFTDSSSGNISGYHWDFGDPAFGGAGDTSNLQNPQYMYSDTGTYVITLTVTTDYGCTDIYIDSIRIKNEYILFVPSAFSPSGDGTNDYFFPYVVGLNKNKFEMYIYDRWGDLIYETRDINKPWDGKANKGGNMVQQDIYVWVINTEDLNQEPHRYIGHVAVMK